MQAFLSDMPYKDRERRLEYYRNYNKKYYWENIEKIKIAQHIKRQRWIQEGRCTSCGTKLVQGENKTCVNCGNTIKGEMKYAKDSRELAEVMRNNSLNL